MTVMVTLMVSNGEQWSVMVSNGDTDGDSNAVTVTLTVSNGEQWSVMASNGE